jgi:hypothetical protein
LRSWNCELGIRRRRGAARSRETALEFLRDLVVEEIMFLRACGGLRVMLGATTSKWDYPLELLFDELPIWPTHSRRPARNG